VVAEKTAKTFRGLLFLLHPVDLQKLRILHCLNKNWYWYLFYLRLLCQVNKRACCSLGLRWCYAEAFESVFSFSIKLCKHANNSFRFYSVSL